MNVLFLCLSARERNYLSGGMSVCVCVCVYERACGLISSDALLQTTDQAGCDQCYRWAAEHRTLKPSIRLKIHAHTDTHSLNTMQWPAATLAVLLCSTGLAYSHESTHAFGRANRSERVHMVLRMPSSHLTHSLFLLHLWRCHQHHLTPPIHRQPLINKRLSCIPHWPRLTAPSVHAPQTHTHARTDAVRSHQQSLLWRCPSQVALIKFS